MQFTVDDNLIYAVIEKTGLAGESAIDIALRLLMDTCEGETTDAEMVRRLKHKKLLKEHIILLKQLDNATFSRCFLS
ncbi:hypothetical protein BegalDRAFT_3153 [Beggiatoa alba B18LD]|uniref:Uncharacterized protein n=1 Tax=Beggiatoa alba B18LD TaxID=395493 RepID=I3CK35_9GAMM|nr:hypothetical protein [Beggiatoa alba]EIJ43978.1 hypothetical protein BegalDRAFT_3153 [Beggiatoa alba B18LD]